MSLSKEGGGAIGCSSKVVALHCSLGVVTTCETVGVGKLYGGAGGGGLGSKGKLRMTSTHWQFLFA